MSSSPEGDKVAAEAVVVVPALAVFASLLILVEETRHNPEYFELTRDFMHAVAAIYGIRPSDLDRGLVRISSSQLLVVDSIAPVTTPGDNKRQVRKRRRGGKFAQKPLWE